jgi:hypothetical protein
MVGPEMQDMVRPNIWRVLRRTALRFITAEALRPAVTKRLNYISI